MVEMDANRILDHQEVIDRIERIAWQIYENSHQSGVVVLAGIAERGYRLAEKLHETLLQISDLQLSLHRLSLNKNMPLQGEAELHPARENFEDCTVVVIDDVLNSGSTLIYGVKYFLQYSLREIKTAVLVDRNHKRYPVKADYKGLSLSTSMREHVDVNILEAPYSVLLS